MKYFLTPIVVLVLCLSAATLKAEEDKDIVSVNGAIIRQSEVMERLWKRYGPSTLDEMVDEILLRQGAQAQGVKADPAEVAKRLARFQGQFGDQAIFLSQLQQSGGSLEKLKADISEQIIIRQLVVSTHKLAVTDEELKIAFQANKAKLGAPPAVHLRHILVATEAEAAAIVDQVKKGADFAKLAREKSLAPTGKLNGGDYGFVSRGMLPTEIETIAFAMKPAELRVLPSAKGFHIMQVVKKRAAKPAEFAASKDELRDMLLDDKIKMVLPDYLQKLRQKADIKPLGSMY